MFWSSWFWTSLHDLLTVSAEVHRVDECSSEYTSAPRFRCSASARQSVFYPLALAEDREHSQTRSPFDCPHIPPPPRVFSSHRERRCPVEFRSDPHSVPAHLASGLVAVPCHRMPLVRPVSEKPNYYS